MYLPLLEMMVKLNNECMQTAHSTQSKRRINIQIRCTQKPNLSLLLVLCYNRNLILSSRLRIIIMNRDEIGECAIESLGDVVVSF